MDAIRARVAARRAQARSVQKPKGKTKKLAKLLLAMLLLLLLLLWRCTPEVPAPPPEAPACPTAPSEIHRVEWTPLAPIPRAGRPALRVETPARAEWLDALRLQVGARSPRVASCFVGVESPGRLRWTALLHLEGGLVTNNTLAPALTRAEITAEQRACVLSALSSPPYRLSADPATPPTRVSLILEF